MAARGVTDAVAVATREKVSGDVFAVSACHPSSARSNRRICSGLILHRSGVRRCKSGRLRATDSHDSGASPGNRMEVRVLSRSASPAAPLAGSSPLFRTKPTFGQRRTAFLFISAVDDTVETRMHSQLLEIHLFEERSEPGIAAQRIVRRRRQDTDRKKGRPRLVRTLQPSERLVLLAEIGVDHGHLLG
jgi:hypothetical protein